MTAAPRQLVSRLFVELFQTERSACEHPRVEAERLGDAPPTRALLAVVAHAERTLPEIERLAELEALGCTSAGTLIGDAFSVLRDWVLDRMLSGEKSYRSTLLGLRHGVDLVRLLRSAARSERRSRVEAFCEAWLAERAPLVEEAARQLDWFGEQPAIALESATRERGRARARRGASRSRGGRKRPAGRARRPA